MRGKAPNTNLNLNSSCYPHRSAVTSGFRPRFWSTWSRWVVQNQVQVKRNDECGQRYWEDPIPHGQFNGEDSRSILVVTPQTDGLKCPNKDYFVGSIRVPKRK
eukprot:scaffold574_cov190-Amphora_coffeaeformis.AAC.13